MAMGSMEMAYVPMMGSGWAREEDEDTRRRARMARADFDDDPEDESWWCSLSCRVSGVGISIVFLFSSLLTSLPVFLMYHVTSPLVEPGIQCYDAVSSPCTQIASLENPHQGLLGIFFGSAKRMPHSVCGSDYYSDPTSKACW
eukprot:gnl/MRDRNA2_/MRDRNA2_59460_c0_seq2.p1 gnl/MRDRNA2_/MRDRNA2_59460_c0~~gnl/MRDRNA2_/MRDRNA2_59460_c0_seq2.p1  ORF type:complete len:143 (-),score=19.29 gnl/MRDRNA2_/MRDRNA2_59460_c0_seq2:185-613(-)